MIPSRTEPGRDEEREAAAGAKIGRNNIDTLVEHLASGDYLVRERAERALLATTPEDLDAILEAVNREEAQRIRRRRALPFTVVPGIAAACAAIALLHAGTPFIALLFYLAFFTVAGFGGLYVYLTRASNRYRSLLRVLASIDNIRVAGRFAEAVNFKSADDYAASRVARNALVRLLPQFRAADSEYLNSEQRNCLCRALEGNDRDLSLAILSALTYVGDAEALPYIKRMSKPDGETEIAAARCMEAINARLSADATRQTLLRASAEHGADSGKLLRAAAGGSIRDDDLVRGSQEPCVEQD